MKQSVKPLNPAMQQTLHIQNITSRVREGSPGQEQRKHINGKKRCGPKKRKEKGERGKREVKAHASASVPKAATVEPICFPSTINALLQMTETSVTPITVSGADPLYTAAPPAGSHGSETAACSPQQPKLAHLPPQRSSPVK